MAPLKDFEQLLESHEQELTNQDLVEMEEQQRVEEEMDEEEVQPKKFDTKRLAESFLYIDKAIALWDEMDPNVERSTSVTNSMYSVFKCYRDIYDERKRKTKQPSLTSFLRPGSSTRSSTASRTTSTASTVSYQDDDDIEMANTRPSDEEADDVMPHPTASSDDSEEDDVISSRA